MQISINDPLLQTQIFIVIFIISLILSLKKRDRQGFTVEITEELKGFAILAVVFSHIGYFLDSQDRFLFPLSVLAGTGVNLFLFLSGFGLYKSWQKGGQSVVKFYSQRLSKLFLPFLVVLISFLLLDKIFLNIQYPFVLTVKNFLGFFPSAEIYQVIDSPLWYFTLILFYYLISPFFFKLNNPYISAMGLMLFSYFVFNVKLPFALELTQIDKSVQDLYRVHLIAFPLGVAFSAIDQRYFLLVKKIKLIILPLSLTVFAYTAINSGVGENKFIEQAVSLVTMFSILTFFVLNNYQFRLLNLFGKYSYEIYLFHWPILYRYEHLFKFLPASMATMFYLAEFFLLGGFLQRLVKSFFGLLPKEDDNDKTNHP